ncbi:MAG TPA: hypothetical protein VGC91_08100 [Pyrinomonadaceae bacterium]|jgi:hypothetical protein
MDYELLDTTGFHFAEMSVSVAVLTANYGDGYGDGALVGSPEGLHKWSIEISLLPDLEEYSIYSFDPSGETRARYLYNLFLRSKAAGNRPFRFVEPGTGKEYFAEFVEHTLTWSQFTAKAFSAQLEIRQRRVRDYESPTDTTGNPDTI